MNDASTLTQTYTFIIAILTVLSVLGLITFLYAENRRMKVELEKAEFQNQKDKDEKAVHAESDADLKSEFNKDIRG